MNSPSLQFVRYSDSLHRDQVIRLWKEVFGYEDAHNEPGLVIDKKLSVSDGLFFVATSGDLVIGTIMAGYDGHRGWIYSLAVAPAYRNAGVGTALLKHAEDELAARGCVKINLQIIRDNKDVQAFYLSNGYGTEERISMGKRLMEGRQRTAAQDGAPGAGTVLNRAGSAGRRREGTIMDVKIRDARLEDGGFIAWLILTSGRAHVTRGIWEVIVDEPEDRVMSFLELLAVSETPHLFHHSCFIIAEAGGVPVAGLGGYDPVVLGHQALLSVVPGIYGKLGMDLPEEMTRGEFPKITSCIPPAPEGAWVIDSVATLPAFRRRGIVDALVDRMLERGREKGYRRAGLSIYIGNVAAQRAYEKHGFTLLDEWRDPYFEKEIGSPGMARMICELA